MSFLAVFFLFADVYAQLFNIFIYGSYICIYLMNILGKWSILIKFAVC